MEAFGVLLDIFKVKTVPTEKCETSSSGELHLLAQEPGSPASSRWGPSTPRSRHRAGPRACAPCRTLQPLQAALFPHPYLNSVLWPNWFPSHPLDDLPFPSLHLCSIPWFYRITYSLQSGDPLNLFLNSQLEPHFLYKVFLGLNYTSPCVNSYITSYVQSSLNN